MTQVVETEEELVRMAEYAERVAQELLSAGVDMIIYGCTSGSFLKGENWNRQFAKEFNGAVERLVITIPTAEIDALKHLRIKEISPATPYPDETNAKTVTWLESVDVKVVTTIEVIKSQYSKPFSNLKISRLTHENVYTKSRPQVKLLSVPFFTSCSSLRSIEIIALLGNDLGLPIATSNQSSPWGH